MDLLKKYKTKLIVDGENALKEIIGCIEESKKSIRIRMFMWRDDVSGNLILDHLEEKIKGNQNIKIYIEKDSFGRQVYNFQKWISLGKLGGDIFSSSRGQDFIKRSQVNFSYVGSKSLLLFKYLKENDHSKVFLFDEFTTSSKVIIGGMNIADEYLTVQNEENPRLGGWHDYMVKLEGNIADNFSSYGGKYSKKWLTKKIIEGIEVLMSIKNKHTVRKEIIKELKKAKESIIIEHGYITDYIVIKKLRKISRKGVNIKIILPDNSDGFWHSNMHSIYKILKPSALTHKLDSNIEVFLYKGMIHSKVIAIDNKIAIIGSANLTNGSFDILRETTAIFRQKDGVVKDLIKQLEIDLKKSTKIKLENIPKYSRILASIQKIFI